jgi:hypothetical protein
LTQRSSDGGAASSKTPGATPTINAESPTRPTEKPFGGTTAFHHAPTTSTTDSEGGGAPNGGSHEPRRGQGRKPGTGVIHHAPTEGSKRASTGTPELAGSTGYDSIPAAPEEEVAAPIAEPGQDGGKLASLQTTEVALEDLPPLEYADLQRANSRRRRRRRAGDITPTATPGTGGDSESPTKDLNALHSVPLRGSTSLYHAPTDATSRTLTTKGYPLDTSRGPQGVSQQPELPVVPAQAPQTPAAPLNSPRNLPAPPTINREATLCRATRSVR